MSERRVRRLAEKANVAANSGNVKKELKLHDRWEKADAKQEKKAAKK